MDLKFDSKSAWDYPFIVIDEKEISLNYIEHEILRKKYFDPRIHFAVNCASFSCPRLLNIAYTEDNLKKQLEQMTKEFVNSNLHNTISATEIEISQLFNWYNGDFIKEVSLIDFLNKYSTISISSSAEISFKEYNWSLNDNN